MSDRVFVDTNVIVSARDGRFPEQQAQCAAWLRALAATRSMVISPQVLKEHRNALRKKLRLEDAMAHSATRDLFRWCTAPLAASEIDAAMTIEARYKTSWWDALILASASAAKCAFLLTEDAQSSPAIEGVRIIDPSRAPEDILGAA